MRDRRIPNPQAVAAAAQILAHDVKAEKGKTLTVIDAGNGRGRHAVEFADQEASGSTEAKQAASARPGFQPSAAAQSTANEISSDRIVQW